MTFYQLVPGGFQIGEDLFVFRYFRQRQIAESLDLAGELRLILERREVIDPVTELKCKMILWVPVEVQPDVQVRAFIPRARLKLNKDKIKIVWIEPEA